MSESEWVSEWERDRVSKWVSEWVSESENERASDDDQELSLKADGPWGVKKRVQFTTENAEPESLLRPYGGDAQSMLDGLGLIVDEERGRLGFGLNACVGVKRW